jgi:DNA polymerase-1
LTGARVGVKFVRSYDKLKAVAADYSDFDEFAIDVETTAGRKARTLSGEGETGRTTRPLLRRGYDVAVCSCCSRLYVPQRKGQKYCSSECATAVNKDRPALDPTTNSVWSVSLAGPGRSDVIPCGHPRGPKQLGRNDVFGVLEPLFFSDRRKVGHNVSFDLLSIAKYFGHRVPPPPYGDTRVLAYLHDETLGGYGLEPLAAHYLHYVYRDKLGERAYEAPFQQAIHYSLVDAKMAWMLWWFIGSKHRKGNFWGLFEREMDVLEVLLDMRVTGAYVDGPAFRSLLGDLRRQKLAAKRYVSSLAGRALNPDSPVQLGDFLAKDLHLPITRRTAKTDRPATNAQTLNALASSSRSDEAAEAIAAILHYKGIAKLLSTYVAGYLPHIEPDNRIRCSYNQAAVKSGRLSSSQPNLQNLPVRSKDTVEADVIRRLFKAPPGYKLIVADFDQIELRVLAHLSGDPLLLEAYKQNIDLHALTASRVFRIPLNQVTKQQRVIGKTANFAFAYGGGPYRIMEIADVTLPVAKMVHKAWHETYFAVERWGYRIKNQCRASERHYVTSLFGRRRRLPDIASDDWALRGPAERQAVNHPIQSTAGDLAKIAMIQVRRAIAGYDARLVLQVHDELVIECAEGDVEAVVPLVRAAMTDIHLNGEPVLCVPLVVDLAVGDNWADCK